MGKRKVIRVIDCKLYLEDKDLKDMMRICDDEKSDKNNEEFTDKSHQTSTKHIINRKYIKANMIYNTKDVDSEIIKIKRRESIGGSDVADIIRVDNYMDRVRLFYDKADVNEDIKKQYEKQVTYKMELGCKLKDFVSNEFFLKTGKKLKMLMQSLKILNILLHTLRLIKL